MTSHNLQLATEPYTAIVSGQKTIESRLFDDKRQLIQLGDEVIFTNRENPGEFVKVKVVGLLRYNTFHDLFIHNDPKKFGGPTVDWLENQINDFYSLADQKEHGVVGIEFQLP